MGRQKIIIIGSGFSSLAASCYLAKAGYKVKVLEKLSSVGGRARQLKREGFTFDIGPTFYWMPDIFDRFFEDFNKKTSDYYQLDKLNPAYQVYFEDGESISIADNPEDIQKTFNQIEKGSDKSLAKFLKKAGSNYDIAIKNLVYQPGQNILELITPQTITKLHEFLGTIKGKVARHVKHPKLRTILEFPVLFLGAKSANTPAFYDFMNYADFGLGTWHPKGGMYEIVKAMSSLAKDLGVEFIVDCPVLSVHTDKNRVNSVRTAKGRFDCDILLSGADYHHTETLLPQKFRQYSEAYWSKKTFAPSALLFFVGFDKKLDSISHHTLFFDTDFDLHSQAIYDTKIWPENPLFYASFSSVTDPSVAPRGKEAGTFLIPIAPGIEDTPEIREKYFDKIIIRLEKITNQSVRDNILFKESFSVNDFIASYNSYKGNAYGLANTLMQTHILRPRLKSKKLKNLYFTGQLTVPGPGVPPSIISGNIVSKLIQKHHAA